MHRVGSVDGSDCAAWFFDSRGRPAGASQWSDDQLNKFLPWEVGNGCQVVICSNQLHRLKASK
jgi:hypothetical protein